MQKVRALIKRTKTKSLALRRAVPTTIKNKPDFRLAFGKIVQKRKSPVRIVFVCMHGLMMSPFVKEQFNSALVNKGIPKNYFSLGSDSMYLNHSKHFHDKVDYFVFTMPGLSERMGVRYPKLFQSLQSNAKIITHEKAGAGIDYTGRFQYDTLFEEIIKRERAKLR